MAQQIFKNPADQANAIESEYKKLSDKAIDKFSKGEKLDEEENKKYSDVKAKMSEMAKRTKYQKYMDELNEFANKMKASKFLDEKWHEPDYSTIKKWYDQSAGYEGKTPLDIARHRQSIASNYGSYSPELAGVDTYIKEKNIQLPNIDAFGEEIK